MSNNSVPYKLVANLVPETATSTKQGPRLRHKNGQFASGSFKEVELTVLPDDTVQWILESSHFVLEGILKLDDRLDELHVATDRLQQGIDQVILRLDLDLRVDLEHARKLLRRADDKGDGAREYLASKEKEIIAPLRKVEIGVEERLANDGLSPEARVSLIRRLLMLRHVRAKVVLACGEVKEAQELLRETRDRVANLVRALFADLTNGVAVLDVPEVGAVDDEVKLLRLMEVIDGVPPDSRRFSMRKSTPVIDDKMRFVPLERKPSEARLYFQPHLHVELGTKVLKGQMICSEKGFDWFAAVSGYLIILNCTFNINIFGGNYNCSPHDLGVVAIPTLQTPQPGFADLVADLAFIMEYAHRLEEEMDLTSGNGSLAKGLALPAKDD